MAATEVPLEDVIAEAGRIAAALAAVK